MICEAFIITSYVGHHMPSSQTSICRISLGHKGYHNIIFVPSMSIMITISIESIATIFTSTPYIIITIVPIVSMSMATLLILALCIFIMAAVGTMNKSIENPADHSHTVTDIETGTILT